MLGPQDPELYDRVRPAYPDALFVDLETITGIGRNSAEVLEIGCGTGQATLSLAARGYEVREPLLEGITDRIQTRMGDRAPRHYLSVIRAGQRRP